MNRKKQRNILLKSGDLTFRIIKGNVKKKKRFDHLL